MKHMLKPVCIKVGLTLFAGACLCGGNSGTFFEW